jgi:hypothetical protein
VRLLAARLVGRAVFVFGEGKRFNAEGTEVGAQRARRILELVAAVGITGCGARAQHVGPLRGRGLVHGHGG